MLEVRAHTRGMMHGRRAPLEALGTGVKHAGAPGAHPSPPLPLGVTCQAADEAASPARPSEKQQAEERELSQSFHQAISAAEAAPAGASEVAAPSSGLRLEGTLGALGLMDLDDLLARLQAGTADLTAAAAGR